MHGSIVECILNLWLHGTVYIYTCMYVCMYALYITCIYQLHSIKGVSSPVGTRGHATTVNNEIVMNLYMNLFLVS